MKSEKKTISVSDQNSNILFLRNELFKISVGLFTMTLFTKISHIYDLTRTKNLTCTPEVGDFLELVRYKISSDSEGVKMNL